MGGSTNDLINRQRQKIAALQDRVDMLETQLRHAQRQNATPQTKGQPWIVRAWGRIRGY